MTTTYTHSCCGKCNAQDLSSLPTHDMDGCSFQAHYCQACEECTACMHEAAQAHLAEMEKHDTRPTCDACRTRINGTFFDAMTDYGPWAILCTACFRQIGLNIGQEYTQDGARRIKVRDLHKR